jgi:hypothetical protein
MDFDAASARYTYWAHRISIVGTVLAHAEQRCRRTFQTQAELEERQRYRDSVMTELLETVTKFDTAAAYLDAIIEAQEKIKAKASV